MELFREARPRRGKRQRFGLADDMQQHASETTFHSQQALATRALVCANPVARACLQAYVTHVTSGGVTLMDRGETTQNTEKASSVLQETWTAFAADVCLEALTSGLVVVAMDEEETFNADGQVVNIPCPIVVGHGDVQVKRTLGGRSGLKPTYSVYNSSKLGSGLEPSNDLSVFVYSNPDEVGNSTSMATSIINDVAFVDVVSSCELNVSQSNCRPKVCTQHRRPQTNAPLVDGLFFDSESRGVQSDDQEHATRQQVATLALQTNLLAEINKLQTQQGNPSKAPPPPAANAEVVSIPEKMEASTSYHTAAGRSDFTTAVSQRDSRVCVGFSVPASLVLPGKQLLHFPHAYAFLTHLTPP